MGKINDSNLNILLENITSKRVYDFENEDNISYYLGNSGVALMLAEYGVLSEKDHYLDKMITLLDKSIDCLNNNAYHPGFSGITGLAWTIKHLENEKVLDGNLTDTIAPYIYNSLKFDIAAKNYDPITGIIGKARFCVENIDDKESYKHLLRAIDGLSRAKIKISSTQVTWNDKQGSESYTEEGANYVYNLGLAHGVAGIISFLSYILTLGIKKDLTYDLLNKAVEWIISNAIKTPKVNFPRKLSNIIPLSNPLTKKVYKFYKEEDYFSPLSWSIGNIGIAAALLNAGIALNDSNLKLYALSIALEETEKKIEDALIIIDKNNLIDVGFCNGTAGAIFLFDYFYKVFDEKKFKEARDTWIELSMKSYNSNNDIFLLPPPAVVNDKIIWERNATLLNGDSGFLLTLLGIYGKGRLKWYSPLIDKLG